MERIAGTLFFVGALFTYYYGGGANVEEIEAEVQRAAEVYIEEYDAPVRSDHVLAFGLASANSGDEKIGIFLTDSGFTYFDPNPGVAFGLDVIKLSSGELDNVKFIGPTVYINIRGTGQIQLRFANAMYAKYFKDRLKEVQGSVEPEPKFD